MVKLFSLFSNQGSRKNTQLLKFNRYRSYESVNATRAQTSKVIYNRSAVNKAGLSNGKVAVMETVFELKWTDTHLIG